MSRTPGPVAGEASSYINALAACSLKSILEDNSVGLAETITETYKEENIPGSRRKTIPCYTWLTGFCCCFYYF